MSLTNPSIIPPQAAQWRGTLDLVAQAVTSEWNDGDNLAVDVFDIAGSKAAAVQRVLEAVSDPSVLAVVTAGLDDDLVEELSLILRFSNVRINPKPHICFDGYQTFPP
jgi:hypothetical protein